MRAAFAIISAGIRRKKLQTAIFAAGSFLCSFFLLSVFVLNFTIDSSFDMVYKKLNAPNMTVSIQETDVTKDGLEGFLTELSYVQDYKISKSYLASNVKLPNRTMDFAFLASSEDIRLDANEVIVNNAVYDIGIGDEIEISLNGHNSVLKIDSVVTDAVNSAPEAMIPYFWINEQELENLTEKSEKGSWLIEVKAEDSKQGVQKFVTDYENYFKHSFDGNLVSYEDIKHSYLFRYKIFSDFFLLLFIFLLVIILIITVLLSQMAVNSDIKKIGILKAIGFTNRQISMNYTLQYLIIAMAANIVGIFAAGILLKTWLSGMFANIDRGMFYIKNLWCYQFLVLLIIGVILYFTVEISVRKIVMISAIDAISTRKKSNHKITANFLLPTPGLLQVNLGLLKCVHRKLETAFVFVLTLGMVLLHLSCIYIIDGVKNADVHLADWGIVEMDIYVSRKTNVDEAESGLLKALDEEPAVDFYYAGLSDNITYRLLGSSLSHNVVGEIYDKSIPDGLEYIFIKGRNPQTYSEAAVGINFAKQNKVDIGDSIIVTRYGQEIQLEIVGIYPSYQQYGNSIRFITNDIREFFGNQADGYYSVVLKDGESANILADKMSAAFPDFDFFPMERSTTRSVNMLLPPMALCMVVFVIMYICILLCMRKIMMIECKKELEIYRFIGFARKKVNAVVRWRFDIPILLGALAAIPLSVYVMPEWLKPLAQQLGLLKIPIYPNVQLVLIGLVGIFICSVASQRVIVK